MKYCPDCKTTKPLADFTRDQSRRGGHFWCCRACKRIRQRGTRERTAEQRRAYKRAYRDANPDVRRIERNRHRARRYGASGTLSVAEWRRICEAANHRCVNCGAAGELTIDHIIPLRDGGPNDATNVQPLCQACNDRKGRRIIDYRVVLV